MSIESVQDFFKQKAPDIEIIELEQSTATVDLAAKAHAVEPGQIAKTLALRIGEQVILIVAAGDSRLDNKKIKQAFGGKHKMLSADDVIAATGHPVGGVCPFGLKNNIPVYCDIRLKNYDMVMPAAGSLNSAVRIKPNHMAELTNADWVDVCK